MLNKDAAIVSMGDINYLGNVFRTIDTDDEFNVVYLGGSITQGCHATTEDERYVNRSVKWWKDNFPKCRLNWFNAGIGGTTSQFGVARAFEHVLSKEPDLVFIEFSVNDDNTPLFMETYESLIRRILKFETVKAVVLINNMFYDDGRNAQGIHNNIGFHYNLPMVSLRNYLWQDIYEGNIKASDLTQDNLHPNSEGHKNISDMITHLLDKEYEYYKSHGVTSNSKPELPKPFTACRYIDSKRYKNKNCRPEIFGFKADTHKTEWFSDPFKEGWVGSKKGSYVEFEFNSSIIMVQWRRTINQPAPVAYAIIDGNQDSKVKLDANFDETWGDQCCLTTLADNLPVGNHKLEIIIDEEGKADSEFMLISIITADNH